LLAGIGPQHVSQFIDEHIRPEQFNLLAYGSKGIRKLARGGFDF